MKTIGSKAEVWHDNALHTSGGLTKDDLMKNKRGRIVSKKKHELGMLAFERNGLQPKTADELVVLRGGSLPVKRRRI